MTWRICLTSTFRLIAITLMASAGTGWECARAQMHSEAPEPTLVAATETPTPIPTSTPTPSRREYVIGARSTLLWPDEISGRSFFVYGNNGYANPWSGTSYRDMAVCMYASNYSGGTRNADDKWEQTGQPVGGSEADVNFNKVCELLFNSTGDPCDASKRSYQAELVSRGVWTSLHDNWSMSWSQATQSWFMIRADGVKRKEWINGAWSDVPLTRVTNAGLRGSCNGYVWTGYNDRLRCICDG